MAETVVGLTLEHVTCECGGTYALAARYIEQKRNLGGGWHCPYCQVGWGYFDGGKLARLEKQLVAKDAALDQARADASYQREIREHAERRVSALRGVVTRTKRSVGSGACPCCGKRFKDLADHMAEKHPKYAEEE